MSETTMPKAYNHLEFEEPLYEWWEKNGHFRPEEQLASGLADPTAKPFVISMPPPNVTGKLHLGHAITSSIEDMLIRYNRMKGRPSLWVPGTDHAGIATQNVVEKQLAKQGIRRQDLGREKFVAEVWDWKAEYHGTITAQQKRMGISCDWLRERFTLDEGLSAAVIEAFLRLYEEGLIYKGLRLVNWCPRCESAISDLEVVYEEENGKFYTFRYPLKGDQGEYLEVSTTRPETILGDTAVAVHPDDERYKHLIGRTALVPILGREIPVIADSYVEMEFGTGALKVTPGHDPNDYEISLRHHLQMINVMTTTAQMNENAGPYAGLDRFVARKKLWADMEAAGLTVKVEDRTHQVGHCERCNTIVEPLLSEQWWVKMQPLAEPAIAAVKDGRIQIVPERFEKVYFHWMENIRDWCISRQLWWGHRVPIWYGPDGKIFAARNAAEAQAKANAHYQGEMTLRQDEDVLDTWFSSGLWPFSTLGWPEQTADLATYYPTTVLETGYDIIFFWVARMIVMGLKFTGEVPFSVVYLHGLVRDEQGRKMSKSLGNAPDPLDLIKDYGADALRFTLLTGGTPGNDVKLAVTRLEANRNFANKLWNAARFVIMNLESSELQVTSGTTNSQLTYSLPDTTDLSLADHWILSRYEALATDVTRLIENWQLGEAGRQIYDFVWGDYCDWYIEAAKVALNEGSQQQANAARQVLGYVLEQSLRLLHPFMPMVTEAIWQNLPSIGGNLQDPTRALITRSWPKPSSLSDTQADESFGRIQEIVRAIRNARAEYNVEPGKRIATQISANEYAAQIAPAANILATLARLDRANLQIAAELSAPAQAITLAVGGTTVYLPLAGMVDLNAEMQRLQKEIENLDKQAQRITGLLSNSSFTDKAKPEVIERERAKLVEFQSKRQQLQERLNELM
ncbi:MAG: valine--tRNA ligase [Caldilineaceae bacterium]